MSKPRNRFEQFCYRNRNKGIPNLMLYLSLGSALVYLMTQITRNPILYQILCFDRSLILRGQVWRLFTYPLTYTGGNIFFTLVGLICYYSLGRAMENYWGTFRFNLFYLTGVVLMDIYSMIFGCTADVYYLNLSLFLSYATLYPDAQFLQVFILPICFTSLVFQQLYFLIVFIQQLFIFISFLVNLTWRKSRASRRFRRQTEYQRIRL